MLQSTQIVEHVFVVDREADWLPVLLRPNTYGGMALDEMVAAGKGGHPGPPERCIAGRDLLWDKLRATELEANSPVLLSCCLALWLPQLPASVL